MTSYMKYPYLADAVEAFSDLVTDARSAENLGKLMGSSVATTEDAERMLRVAVEASFYSVRCHSLWPAFRTGWNGAVLEPLLHQITTPWPTLADISGALGDRTENINSEEV